MVRDDEDSDEDMPELEQRNHDDSSDDEKEEEDTTPVRAPIARKKTVLFKDVITNNPIVMQEKLQTINVNDAYHK